MVIDESYLRLYRQKASDAEGPETARDVTLSLGEGCHAGFRPLLQGLMGEGEATELRVPAFAGDFTR